MNRYTFSEASVSQAIDFLKEGTGPQPSFLTAGDFTTQNGSLYLGRQLVVPQEQRDELLRKILYKDPGGPMGRDSLYHFIQPSFLGIPRSYVLDFLRKQKIFQDVKAMPRSEIKNRGQIYHKKLGVVESDLVHLTPGDAPFWLKRGSHRFFVVVCCVMTGFTVVRLSKTKNPSEMIQHWKKMFPLIEKYFPIRVLRSDSGGEFKNAKVSAWVLTQNIKQKFVPLASMVENRNRLFQRAFFTRARAHKGKLYEAIASAQATVNNTLNRKTGLTPLQAITKTSKELRELRRKKRHSKPGVSTGPIRFEKGAQVRATIIARKDKDKGYKSYKAETWGPILTVKQGSRIGKAYKYLLSSGKWRWADELMRASPEDFVSKAEADKASYSQDDETYFGKEDSEYKPAPKRKPKKKPKKKPSLAKKKPSQAPSKPTGRRSKRLRGKRVDYGALETKYDFLEG